jgi:casein kinase I family protein HRR25
MAISRERVQEAYERQLRQYRAERVRCEEPSQEGARHREPREVERPREVRQERPREREVERTRAVEPERPRPPPPPSHDMGRAADRPEPLDPRAIPRPSKLPADLPHVLADRYVIDDTLGAGAFGSVYVGHSHFSHRRVAFKVEKMFIDYPQLVRETNALLYLEDKVPAHTVPTVWCKCEVPDAYHVTIMELLGSSLHSLLNRCGGRFSNTTTLLLGWQLVDRMQAIHEALILHRDIKPENFVIGLGDWSHRIHVIDFGMMKPWFNKQTGAHIPEENDHPVMGTPRYCSIDCHENRQLSRRNDMESIGYMLAYFLLGELPWQFEREGASPEENRRIYRRMCDMKKQLGPFGLRTPVRMPMIIIEHARSLKFRDKPNYELLKREIENEIQLQPDFVEAARNTELTDPTDAAQPWTARPVLLQLFDWERAKSARAAGEHPRRSRASRHARADEP